MLKKIFRLKWVSHLLAKRIISNFALKNSTIIILYHGVSFKPPLFHKLFNLNVNPVLFEKQILWLKKNFNIISPTQILKNNYKKPAAMITFDDGDKSYIKYAIPILKKHNIASINFLNMGVIKGELSWAGIVTYLTHIDKKFKSIDYLNINKNMLETFCRKINKKNLYKKIKKYVGNFLTINDLKKIRKK